MWCRSPASWGRRSVSKDRSADGGSYGGPCRAGRRRRRGQRQSGFGGEDPPRDAVRELGELGPLCLELTKGAWLGLPRVHQLAALLAQPRPDGGADDAVALPKARARPVSGRGGRLAGRKIDAELPEGVEAALQVAQLSLQRL